MTLWGLYTLVIAGVFSAITSLYLFRETERYKFLCLLCACFFFTAANFGLILQSLFISDLAGTILNWLIQWGSISCIALVLCALLFFLRELKPKTLQLHRLYALIPLLVIIPYFLVFNSEALKTWLLIIYEASAVTVGIVLHTRYYLRHRIFRTAFIGAILFLLSFLLSIFLPQSYALIWRLILTVSIITVFSGYLIVNNYSREQLKRSYEISL